MKKMFFLALTLVAGLLGASASQAQLIDVNAGPNQNNKASGSFHVVINQIGVLTYRVTLTGNADGKTPNSSPPGSLPQKGGAGGITFAFFDSSFGSIPIITGSGFTNAYGGDPIPSAPYNTNTTNDGGVIPFGSGGGSWTPNTTGWSQQGIYSTYVAPFGGNHFTGTFTTTTALGSGDSVSIGINNNGENWGAEASITPEPGSLALILPGLAPLGFALRRRRRSSK